MYKTRIKCDLTLHQLQSFYLRKLTSSVQGAFMHNHSHRHSHSHSHAEHFDTHNRAFAITVVLNLRFVLIEAVYGVLVNGITMLLFLKGQQGDLNIRGAFLHMAAAERLSEPRSGCGTQRHQPQRSR